LVTVMPEVCACDSISTVLPDGPSVDLTASDSLLMPLMSLCRPSSLNASCFGV